MSTIDPSDAPAVTFAVIYAAKSTEDKNLSNPEQVEDARAMAAEHGWTVAAEYSDEGFSAYSGNRGPGLARAKAHAAALAAESGSTCMLVAQVSDRFARGAGDRPGAPMSLGEIWHAMRRQDVHLRTVLDDEDMRDEASVAAIGRRAMLDSKLKGARVKKGMARRAKKGLHNGRATFGFTNREGVWEIDEERASVVRRIFRMWVDGTPQLRIARALSDEGVPPPGLSARWNQGDIAKYLRCRHYVNDQCACGHPPIIDADTFARAQALLGGRHSAGGPNRRTAAGHLFLGGYLICGWCLSPLTPRTDKRRTRTPEYAVYQCMSGSGRGPCAFPPVRRDLLEGALVHQFVEARVDVAAMVFSYQSGVEDRVAEVAEGRRRADLDRMRAEDRTARIRTDYLDGALSATSYEAMLAELTSDAEASAQQAAHLAAREAELRADLTADAFDEVERFVTGLKRAAAGGDRDPERLDALRAAFRQLFPAGFTVTPQPALGPRSYVVDYAAGPVPADGERVALPVSLSPMQQAFPRSRPPPPRRPAPGRPPHSAR
jgi:DNA invertase Pin-like site-specific DNA recombinase